MKNPYLRLERIEFVVTLNCTGRCAHCSVGPQLRRRGRPAVDPDRAAAAVSRLAAQYGLRSVMTFGGEPLLFPAAVCAVHRAASLCGIPARQLITNGYFSRDPRRIEEVAARLAAAGVNDVLLSVDAFHQQTIPLGPVRCFAAALLRQKIGRLRLHPAWVVDAAHRNRYNERTREILDSFSDLGIGSSGGNDIFPAGNAAAALREFYPAPARLDLAAPCGEAPYTDRLDDVRCLSVGPDGSVDICAFTIGNLYEEDLGEILARYDPTRDERMRALLSGGPAALLGVAANRGVTVDLSGCASPCMACRKILAALGR